jgi:hypothetical protein
MGLNDRTLEEVAFLQGSWATARAGDAREYTEEHWTRPTGGTMVGMSRVVSREADGSIRMRAFEHLRIERREDGTVEYLASPGGRWPPTAFRLVRHGDGVAVFENPGNEYPSRIIYRLDPENRDVLIARIEGVRGGHADSEAWRYERQR